jgi:hypothetical protein
MQCSSAELIALTGGVPVGRVSEAGKCLFVGGASSRVRQQKGREKVVPFSLYARCYGRSVPSSA